MPVNVTFLSVDVNLGRGDAVLFDPSDRQGEFTRKIEFFESRLERVEIQPGVDERTEYHIAADA